MAINLRVHVKAMLPAVFPAQPAARAQSAVKSRPDDNGIWEQIGRALAVALAVAVIAAVSMLMSMS